MVIEGKDKQEILKIKQQLSSQFHMIDLGIEVFSWLGNS